MSRRPFEAGDAERIAAERRRIALELAVECMKPHITPGAPERVVACARVFDRWLNGEMPAEA